MRNKGAFLAGVSTFAVSIFISAVAVAQPDQSVSTSKADSIDVVVVTGMRASMRNNAVIKKKADQISDSITATDIGKLPDASVLETLTRVPGVQAYRFGGEAASPVGTGSGMTLRGLTNQTASRINGRAFFTAGQRDFNIEGTVPAIVSGVDVYKNPTAEQIEGGIGGVVNVRTLSPFDFKALAASASVGAKYNDLQSQGRPDVFGMVSNRWRLNNGGELGVLVGASFSQTVNRGDNSPGAGGVTFVRAINGASSEYAAGASAGIYNSAYVGRADVNYLASVTPSSLTDRSGVIAQYGVSPNTQYEMYVRTRKGLNAKVEYRFSPNLKVYGEGLYNFYQYHQRFGFLIPSQSSYVQNIQTAAFTTTEGLANRNINGGTDETLSTQRLIGGTFLNSTLNITTGAVQSDYITKVLATGFNWTADAKTDVNVDLTYVEATKDSLGRDMTFAPAATSLTWDITRNLSLEPHTFTFGGADISNRSTWVYRDFNQNRTLNRDNGIAIKADVIRRFDSSLITDVKAGLRYATLRDSFRSWDTGRINLTTDALALASNRANAISVASRGNVANAPNNFMDGQIGYAGGYVMYNSDDLLGSSLTQVFPNSNIPTGNNQPLVPLNSRNFAEATSAAFVQADFQLLDERIKGNIGVRAVKTDTTATANVSTSAGIVPNTKKSSYNDMLPTFNLIGYISPDTLVRFGYGKSMTRPDPASLNPSVIVNTGAGTASVGNTALLPQRGTSYDISLEHYMKGANYVSANVFYKDVAGFFTTSSACETVSGFTYAGSINQGCTGGQYLVTRTVNALQGYAKGIELAGQTFLDYDFVPAYLHNFGVSGSFTYVDTNAPVKTSAGLVVNARLPFSSKYNYTLSGMYEDKNVSARLVYTYRSEAIFAGIGTNPVDSRYFTGYGLLDATVNVNLPRNLQLVLTASNLTNAAPNRFVGEPDATLTGIERQHFLNGRTFGASVRWKFGA